MKKLFLAILASFGLASVSCAQKENIKTVNAVEFQKAIQNDSVQLLDVRTPGEYQDGHIAYAKNIDIKDSTFDKKANAVLDKKKPVYVYCHSGRRSMVAAHLLAKEGYKIVNLQGGIMEWTDAQLPVTH